MHSFSTLSTTVEKREIQTIQILAIQLPLYPIIDPKLLPLIYIGFCIITLSILHTVEPLFVVIVGVEYV